jgi:hypothetical protein
LKLQNESTSSPCPLLLKEKGVKERLSDISAPLLQERGWGEVKKTR